MESIPSKNYWHSGNLLRLVTVGRLEPYKNTEAILHAVAIVKREYPLISLDVVGDGVCLRELKKLSSDLSIADLTSFHGYVSHPKVMEILANSHLFVFPTLREGFPKVVLEALASGVPVVTNPVSVLPHLIGNQNGILLNRNDPEAIAEAILQLIGDEKRLSQMSASARQTAREYTLERWQKIIGERLRANWGPLRQDQIPVSSKK
jgi:glycosyltransferase involved in cell wall biosynthesis